MADFDLGLAPGYESSAPAQTGQSSSDIDLGLPPPVPVQPSTKTWAAQYAANPSNPILNRVGAATLEEGRRIGAGAYGLARNAVTGDWFAPLAHQVGQETAANVATPQTAGRMANVAALTTPGDIIEAPFVSELRRVEPRIPAPEELYQTSDAQYDAARDMGVYMNPDHVAEIAQDRAGQLFDKGIHPADAPRTYAKLSVLGSAPNDYQAIPLSALESTRRGFMRIISDKSPAVSDTDRQAASIALEGLQGFMENPPSEAVLAGPASAASAMLREARGNWAAAKRSDLITDTERAADYRAATANSGRNYDNTLRQVLRPLADPRHPQRLSGFTPEERQAVVDTVTGADNPVRNTLRTVGNLGAGGHGAGASVLGIMGGLAGEHIAGPAGMIGGAALPFAGSAARTAQNALARRSVENLGAQLRRRSPLFIKQQAAAPFEASVDPALITAGRAAIADNLQNNQSERPTSPNPPFYAKGGAVKSSHDRLVSRLMSLAETAKREEKARTKSILGVPDDAVTTALARANAAI